MESRCWRARARCFSVPASWTCAGACWSPHGRTARRQALLSKRRELRLLSLADRAAGLQLVQLSLDRGGVDVRLEASFALAGLGMEPVRLEQDLGAWRTEGTRKAVAMTGAAALRLGGDLLAPDRPFPLRWAWRWRSVAEQVVEFDRLIAVARSDAPDDDAAPLAGAALGAQSCSRLARRVDCARNRLG